VSTITTLLVANRGEIARRVFRTARNMALRTVAVYVEADALSPHVTEADDAVLLPTGYLDGDAILAAAKASGADAIHPGYGFLSENAVFAQAVIDAGVTWVGPPPAAIAAMGDKVAAKRLAVEAGVPTLPMAEDPSGAAEIGFPLLVKAAAGGGGKGMRVVASAGELADAVEAARREALSGFGDERVFLERYVERSRHVEIQILGDQHGNVIHAGERECSIQRRHQKVVEESPSPVVNAEMRAQMGEAAIALARRLGYHSAGTVEFLVEDTPHADGWRPFWFLEVNTRLQVEHPVTELVTGLDLVEEQLRIAMGQPLRRAQSEIGFHGHAIEVRLYAEDPAAGFLPATGTLHAYEPDADPRVRWDAGIETGSVITTGFDPMLAKVIGHGHDRAEAAHVLALALERTHLAGVTTNRDLLVAILRSGAFLAGDTTTDFFDRVQPARVRGLDPAELRAVAVAATLWQQGVNRAEARVWAELPTGWRNARLPDSCARYRRGDDELEVRYRARRDGSFEIDRRERAVVRHWSPGTIDVELDGRRVRARITRFGDTVVVHDGRGDVELTIVPTFELPGHGGAAGDLDAPMPGKVLDVRVRAGDTVTAGTLLLVLEAMKMEHRITAPYDGTVTAVHVAAGDQVERGATLLVVEEVAS